MTTRYNVPGMPRQPFMDAAPELVFDPASEPVPEELVRLCKKRKSQ